MSSCNCRRGNRDFLSVSQILTKDISGNGPQNVAVIPVSHTVGHTSVDSSMNLRNWPPQGFSLEVILHPQSRWHAMKIVVSMRMLQGVNLLRAKA